MQKTANKLRSGNVTLEKMGGGYKLTIGSMNIPLSLDDLGDLNILSEVAMERIAVKCWMPRK